MDPKRTRRRPQGLELRFLWGERIVGEFFMKPGGPAAFTVGSASGVDFTMGHLRLGGHRFEVVRRDEQGFELRFTSAMSGAVTRGGEALSLLQAIEVGRAEPDGGAFALPLEPGDQASVELGGLRLEAFFQPVPHPVLAALTERLDYPALNIFLAVFFIGALFVIAAENQPGPGEEYSDELDGPPAHVKKQLVRLAVAPPNDFAQRMRAKKLEKAAAPAAHERPEGQAGDRKAPAVNRRASPAGNPAAPDRSRTLIRSIFNGPGGSATSALFEGTGLGGELEKAVGNISGEVFGSAPGLEGMGLRGTDSGGGGDQRSAGIGQLPTRGRGNGELGYGESSGLPLGPKPRTPIPAGFGGVQICGGDGSACGLDRDLVRQVIHAHRSQIRYCYEDQLTRYPALAGKVAVRFIIGASGGVNSSDVAHTTVHNAGLEACVVSRVRSWVFPKPRAGSAVVVTYPFLFKPSGE